MFGSTIEYAEIAAQCNNGGIIIAKNTSFKDNIVDLTLYNYTISGSNVSYIQNCNLYTTQNLYDKGYSPTYHIDINQSPGFNVKGSRFYNNYASDNGLHHLLWGYGIKSINSSLSVIPYIYNGTVIRCGFSDLDFGIKLDL
jgi:hypothetical protein